MNKNTVNEQLNYAYEALRVCNIANNGKIKKSFRGQISSFGAAITMGSLQAAIAFFSQQAGAEVDRSQLLKAILYILKKENNGVTDENLFEYVNNNKAEAQENVINASIALKLAMNLYELVD